MLYRGYIILLIIITNFYSLPKDRLSIFTLFINLLLNVIIISFSLYFILILLVYELAFPIINSGASSSSEGGGEGSHGHPE